MTPKPKHDLLTLPPELLLRILSYLPLKALLTFSLTSQYCLAFSHNALPDLAFAIYPSRLARNLAYILDLGGPPEDDDNTINPNTSAVSALLPKSPRKSNRITLLIPQAESVSQTTLLAFHDALHQSILLRYAVGLRVLDLSIWRLGRSIAAALRELRGLVSLKLEVRDPFVFEGVLMGEEEGVWDALVVAWKGLKKLGLGGMGITAAELGTLLKRNWGIRELWLKRCEVVLSGIWSVLREWEGRVNLMRLGFVECGVVTMDCLEAFRELEGLQVSFFSVVAILFCASGKTDTPGLVHLTLRMRV